MRWIIYLDVEVIKKSGRSSHGKREMVSQVLQTSTTKL